MPWPMSITANSVRPEVAKTKTAPQKLARFTGACEHFRISLNARRVAYCGCPAVWFRNLLRLIPVDHQLISNFGTAAKNRMCRQLDHALGAQFGQDNSERPYHLLHVHHPQVLVYHDQVER